jgi:hypothetical protein
LGAVLVRYCLLFWSEPLRDSVNTHSLISITAF